EKGCLRKQEGKKRSGSLALAWRALARLGKADIPAILPAVLLPQVFGAHTPGFCGDLVGGYADASPHNVQETGTGVLEGCLRHCVWGLSAPRRECAPTARQMD